MYNRMFSDMTDVQICLEASEEHVRGSEMIRRGCYANTIPGLTVMPCPWEKSSVCHEQ